MSNQVEEYTLDEEGNEVATTPSEFRLITDSGPMRVAASTMSEAEAIAKRDGHMLSKPKSGLAARLVPKAGEPHVEVAALAGAGKTTCVIEGLKSIKGIQSPLSPSDQQAAVWEAMGAGKHGSVRVSAFSTKITDELKSRIVSSGLHGRGVEAKGIHGLGVQAVSKRFGRVSADKSKWVVADICAELMGTSVKNTRGTKLHDQIWAVDSLVSLCKQTLTDPTPENLDMLSSRYDVELNGRNEIYSLVPQVLQECLIPKNGQITFDDMIWLPLKHDLPIYKVDLQIVDECQDLNRMQQQLMYRSGHRLLFVGDRHQAIMGFAGADSEGMDRMKRELNAISIPLTVTRRCGKNIVKEAQAYVPQYEAHESNPLGLVDKDTYRLEGNSLYRKAVQPGDMILCRTNAPLTSQCFKFIKEGRKAIILGKKIGEGLTSLIQKSRASTVPNLIAWLDDWMAKEIENENAKRNPSENRIDGMRDRYDCILAFCEGLSDVNDVNRKISSIFTDDNDNRAITLSSKHKSKGLESKRVFILDPKESMPRLDKMQAWEREQLRNLEYVAITRAIEELYFVR